MTMHRRASFAEERGATLIYLAIMLLGLIGMIGLALDGGYAYFQYRRMQTAADAAALAGARHLSAGESEPQIDAAINQLAQVNGAETVTWQYTADAAGVRVTAQIHSPTWFAPLFGLNNIPVSAVGEASFAPAVASSNLLPMTTTCADFEYGVTYKIWEKTPGSQTAPGNFGWLDWNGVPVGAAELAQNILNPQNSGVWYIGDYIPGGPGVKNTAGVRNALNTWLGQHVTIPLHDQVIGKGANAKYRVCGFAEFVLTGYNFRGSSKWVQGYFIRYVDPDVIAGDAPDYGVGGIKITQ
ncbi:MAG: hypothetical protein GXP42_19715 [Chloroflexi bacterium]|nr:hypothetical protein [Chloroflexota bacterium]